ncbi:hypothetical protein ASO20_00760 [Mycoplasma sp. (ex Biomphalaria glabrata)]|uniref:hypothetical protein n=1 Tax=Mycoplasma sp. (ex Biomphalaria glabrata) TaxID=1749074 RepID=UPI00073A600F|nr:hypothetical protein [Mycoplasma sp. (ex Biomphalaria glabrata)]ALV23207.1 hypothetical protein ASO20_00760 [Mycoplasma sp. (ex Biomphalaria glabrata)]
MLANVLMLVVILELLAILVVLFLVGSIKYKIHSLEYLFEVTVPENRELIDDLLKICHGKSNVSDWSFTKYEIIFFLKKPVRTTHFEKLVKRNIDVKEIHNFNKTVIVLFRKDAFSYAKELEKI